MKFEYGHQAPELILLFSDTILWMAICDPYYLFFRYHTLLGTYRVADLQTLPSSHMLATSLQGSFLRLDKADGVRTLSSSCLEHATFTHVVFPEFWKISDLYTERIDTCVSITQLQQGLHIYTV